MLREARATLAEWFEGSLGPVFEGVNQFCQEGIGLVGIHDTVVDGQADIAHWPHDHDVLAINFPYFDALFNLSDTQNGRLRLIDDDGCGDQAA